MKKSIPKTVSSFLFLFLSVLSKPQRKHFLVYLVGLSWMIKFRSIRTIAQGFGHHNVDGLHHFMRHSPQAALALEEVNQQAAAAAIGRNPALLIIDDTPCPRKGKHIEGLAIHHGPDGLVKGLCAVTSIVKAGTQRFIFAMRGYRPKTACLKKEFRSKVQLALDILHQAQTHFQQSLTVLMDSWYTCEAILKVVIEAKWIFLGAIKRNRILYVNGRKTNVCHLAKGPRRYRTVRLSKKKRFRIAKLLVDLPKAGRVLLFISKRGKETRFFITNKLDMTEEEMARLYCERWWIETFHQEIKQYLGFGELFTRSWHGVQKHWTLVAIAYNMLVFWRSDSSKSFRQRVRRFRESIPYKELLRLPRHLKLAA